MRKYLSTAARLGIIALALAATGSRAQTAPDATPASAAAPAPVQTVEGRPALWVVRDADTTIYLFGTVHIMRPGVDWFRGPVRQAFDGSSQLVTEIIQPEQAAMMQLIGRLGVAQDGVALTARMSPEQRATYVRAMESSQLPVAAFERLEPWVASIILTVAPLQARGYDPAQGVEMTLSRSATTANKQTAALETAEQQLGLFDALPMPSQVDFLAQTSANALREDDQLGRMIELWRTGDVDALGAMMNAEMGSDPALRATLLTNRNRAWSEWIASRLAENGGSYFVAVGAGHLTGDGSVQQFLHERGIEAQRVPN
jgi:uncharacterized protein YbaP (TraB family)